MAGKIAREILQNKPFRCLEEEAFLNLAKTHEHLMQGFVELFRKHELTPTQYNILRILRGAGEEGLNCSEAARRTITHDPDITRLFDRLENNGLLRRQRGQEDRRVVKAFLSEKGYQVLAALEAPVGQLHAEQMQRLSAEEIQVLVELLERLRP
jgi:DNA-binding MarR family transcriptional regulator